MWGYSRSIFQTRTFWLNLLGGIVTIAGILSGVLPPKYAAIAVAVQNSLNVWVRLLTTDRVTVLGEK